MPDAPCWLLPSSSDKVPIAWMYRVGDVAGAERREWRSVSLARRASRPACASAASGVNMRA